jgi:hypothetical protein
MVSSTFLYLASCFVLLVAANFLMLYNYTNYSTPEAFINFVVNGGGNFAKQEGFANYQLGGAASGDNYTAIGAYDNVRKVPANGVSAWRDTAPNEPLAGPEFTGPSPDNLFIFKNNQCKPECCGSSYSCGGGCVCTTPAQRQMIASRGGNRNAPEDGI